MSPEAQTILWGAAVLAPLVINLATKRRADAIGLSVLLVMIWVLSRMLWAFYVIPIAMIWYAPMDLVGGRTAFLVWRNTRKFWAMVLTATFTLQLMLHTAFWAAWLHYGGWDSGEPSSILKTLEWRYIFFNNAVFIVQLLCVSSPGVRRVGSHALSRLPRRLRPHRHTGT